MVSVSATELIFFQFLIEAIQVFHMELWSQSLFNSKEEVLIL